MGSGSSKPTPPPEPPKKPAKKKEDDGKLTDAQLIKSGFGTKPGNDKK